MDLIALQGMQRYRTARAPNEIGRVGADDKGTFFFFFLRQDGLLCFFFLLVMSRRGVVIR